MTEPPFLSTAPFLGPGDVLITSRQLCEMAGGVSQMSLWRWLQTGILPSPIRIQGRRYWSRAEVTEALRRHSCREAGAHGRQT